MELSSTSQRPVEPAVEEPGDEPTLDTPAVAISIAASPTSAKLLISISIAYLSVFIDMLGISIILPIVPFLAKEMNATSQQVGFIFAAYAGAQMISTPICGRASDKFGRRPIMIMSLAGSFGGFLLQGLAKSVGFFIFARFAAGVFGGSIPICQAFIADSIPQEKRAPYFAVQGVVITVAFTFGPGIGAGLAQFTMQTPMFVASGLAAFGLILAIFFFHPVAPPQPKPPSKKKEAASSSETDSLSLRSRRAQAGAEEEEEETAGGGTSPETRARAESKATLKSHRPVIIILWLTSLVNWLAISVFIYILGIYLLDRFKWTSLEVGFVTMGGAATGIVMQLTVFVWLVKKIGRHGSAIVGSGCLAVGFVSLALLGKDLGEFRGAPLLVVGIFFSCTGQVIVSTAATSILSRYATPHTQGLILGVQQSFQALARTIGPILWTAIFDSYAPLPFWVAAALSFVGVGGFFLTLLFNRRLPEKKITVVDPSPPAESRVSQLDPEALVEEVKQLRRENALLRQRLGEAGLLDEDALEMMHSSTMMHNTKL